MDKLRIGVLLRKGRASMLITDITVSVEGLPETMFKYTYEDAERIPKIRMANARDMIDWILFHGWKIEASPEQ